MRRSRIRLAVPFSLPLLIVMVASFSLAAIRVHIDGAEHLRYNDTTWPTESRTLSSPFGPRLKASEGFRYDYHRGIDIPDELGSPIFSIADGEVYRTYREGESGNPYPTGGTVVVIRHQADQPFELAGEFYSTYYSVYMHLDSFSVDAAPVGGPYQAVSKGHRIASMGSSGSTTFVHLHFEIRVGTVCSIESSCSHDFDPHVNPLMFFDYPDGDSLNVQILSQRPLKVRVSSARDELDFNSIAVQYGDMQSAVNFNTREGIDPYHIDNPTPNGVTIMPTAFNVQSERYEIDFYFNNLADYDRIEVKDFNGAGIRLENQIPQIYDGLAFFRIMFSRKQP
jgi:murein DD-endopeptidase MepM/ murein hydrolase activator NlpD